MARRFVPKRLPITAAFAGRRTALARFNSTSSASGSAARVMQMAAQADKPSPFEASVPVMWLLSGAAIFTAWNRIDEKQEDHVEKLLIV
ncbi:hypothetical protein K469DRAFT_713110 [Zopfia rhizophila CBS 207.26]|uniref:Uncharacterized protein n=1 Tax=Zopfia rhizophila CBS 207.26 TaxID=1314779 RepID=A0A6A6DVL9_9PEZI|nr:hypothetical protein K469DRAFT_713110 [Zopfia rhizophila CBS 207.26]